MQFHCLFDGSKTQTDCRIRYYLVEGNVALLDLKMKPSKFKSTELLENRLHIFISTY